MAIPPAQLAKIESKLRAYCDDVPPHVRSQVRYGYSIVGNAIEFFTERTRFNAPKKWEREPIAKFRYVATRRQWELYCQHVDLEWHRYEMLPYTARFDTLLAEVELDPTGIFWG